MNGVGKTYRGGIDEFHAYLNRNGLNLIDTTADDDSNDFVVLKTIRSISVAELRMPFRSNYVLVDSDEKRKFDNANDKVQAWTDSLEAEAGNALSKFLLPISSGLYQITHDFQVFARHRYEQQLRERDGFFVSMADKAALLVSVKARFGPSEQNELIKDLYGDKFILSEWMFETAEREQKTLVQMPNHYPNLRGIKELDFYGIAVSPLFDPSLPEHPRIIRFSREIPHDMSLGSSASLGTLIAAKIAARVARKLSF